MATLTVTEQGQVTFRKEVLEHLGIRRGDKIELKLAPGGRATLEAARPTGSIQSFIGLLAGKSATVLTIDEMNEAIADGWTSRFERVTDQAEVKSGDKK
jgi:bifunctional DNA-binding transcriptional regulator/antitoxin component of YhaV-PrlF toxin-antitoxin module